MAGKENVLVDLFPLASKKEKVIKAPSLLEREEKKNQEQKNSTVMELSDVILLTPRCRRYLRRLAYLSCVLVLACIVDLLRLLGLNN